MRLRPATQSDLPTIAAICVAAFSTDELFAVTNPRSSQFPDDFWWFWLRKLRRRLIAPGSHMIVCVEDSAEDGREVILGHVVFERHGGPSKYTLGSLLDRLNLGLYALEDAYSAFVFPDRSEDRAVLRNLLNHMENHDPFARIPSYWYLRGLTVAPWGQRRGAGELLTRWGIERAKAEGLPACVAASEVGTELYRKVGFRVVDWLGLLLGYGKDTRYMIWDWEGKWVENSCEKEGSKWIEKRGMKLPVEVVWIQNDRIK